MSKSDRVYVPFPVDCTKVVISLNALKYVKLLKVPFTVLNRSGEISMPFSFICVSPAPLPAQYKYALSILSFDDKVRLAED